ncbi:MAG: hypothetical protein JXQ73_21900 [Phycisphaerae bacterium]|nr:hypothetical protein [Phycisphaerae bacterium]
MDLFHLLARSASAACRLCVPDYSLESLPSHERPCLGSLETFATDIIAVCGATSTLEVRLLFLLDEAKRVLSSRFPRAFQDNLFALLYDDDLQVGSRIGVVLAGAQELYSFCEDSTSPLGSRAAFHPITNLSQDAVAEIVHVHFGRDGSEWLAEDMVEWVYSQTGGHAGLTAALSRRLSRHARKGEGDLRECVQQLVSQHYHLFRGWHNKLSDEALSAHDALLSSGTIGRRSVSKHLHENGYDPFGVDRACEELQFTGVAVMDKGVLTRVNEIYWEYVLDICERESGSSEERCVWAMIEEVERSLRMLVTGVYERLWPGESERRMRRTLSKDDIVKADKIRDEAPSRYRFSPMTDAPSFVECLYLGQLTSLMVANHAWGSFRSAFRDKRQLEDLVTGISLVRNDLAHFRKVPDKELMRCRICCDDLGAIVVQELQKVSGAGEDR